MVETMGEETGMKVAAIATLMNSEPNLLVSEPEVITSKLQNIIAAETPIAVESEIKMAFKEIKLQHTRMFVDNVTEAVKESAIAVGFNDIVVQQPKAGLVRVVATAPDGKNLISEIDSKKKVDIHTELVGFTDGYCKKVMESFDEALSSKGIKSKVKKMKPTCGIPQMPYAKTLAKRKSRSQLRVFEDETEVNQNEVEIKITLKS